MTKPKKEAPKMKMPTKKNFQAAISGVPANTTDAGSKKRGAGPGRPVTLPNHKRVAFNLDETLIEKLKAKANAETAGNASYLLNQILQKALN